MKRAATPRLRGRAGQKQRLRRLKRSRGLCEHCLREKRTVAATVVDHIVPLALGGSDGDDNTRNLCDAHHAIATAEQFGFKASGACDASGFPTDPKHPWAALAAQGR